MYKKFQQKGGEKCRQYTRKRKEKPKHMRGESFNLFKAVVKRVCMLNAVFRKMREFAIEKGGHGELCTGAMQLKDSVVENGDQKDLLFNPNDFKIKYQFSFPKWARETCSLRPADRSKEQIQNLASLMKQLKDFRKYSKKMLTLLAKIVRYERFGRRRVIVRKGHIGVSFYVIFSGTVGIVMGKDEDKAFENEERAANVLKKGDSFGEIALVRRSTRSATVVCLENTEFLVIDKVDFFASGIEKCAQEEMLHRYSFMKSLDLFKTWKDDVIKEVAEGGRNIDFLTDRVIELDSMQSEFVYVITRGTCDVLRLLDLTTQDYLNERKTNCTDILSASSGYHSAYSSTSCHSKLSLPVYNSPLHAKSIPSDTLSHLSETSLDKRFKVQFSEGHSSSSLFKQNTLLKNISVSNRRQSLSTPELRNGMLKLQKNMPVVFSRTNRQVDWSVQEGLQKEYMTKNIGLGTFIRIDSLTQGQAFGLKYLLHEDDQDTDCKRKFILISCGCEVIRIPKTVLKTHLDEVTTEKIKLKSFMYPSDEDLYQVFKRQNNWRSFREELVDHVVEYRSNVEKALKERCASIPKLPKIQTKNTLRVESPTEHWHKLVETGLITKSSCSSWSLSPTPLIIDDGNKSPFLQDRIISSKGSQRSLVLTHGGSRVNKLQASTNCQVARPKNRTRLIKYIQK